MTNKKNPSDLVQGVVTEGHDLELAKAKSETAKWRRQYGQVTKDLLLAEERFDAMIGISTDFPTQKLKRSKRLDKGAVAAVAPATDWHVEERVFKEAVNGKNKFDLKIAETRIKCFYSGIVENIEYQNHRKRVSELWHPLLGDLLTGYIHEELLETNTLSPVEACVFLQEMICSGIDFLLKETGLPIYLPTCCGNHSRTTVKKRIKTSHKNSFEWMLYMTLARYYKSEPRVTFKIGEGYHNICEIIGRKVRFHHGDSMRYQGGVGGVTIPVNKSIAQWNKLEAVDLDVFGHFHQFLFHYPSWVCCSSLIGYSEFSLEIKADFQHPSQAFLIIDREYGIVEAKPIFLTDPWRKQKGKRK